MIRVASKLAIALGCRNVPESDGESQESPLFQSGWGHTYGLDKLERPIESNSDLGGKGRTRLAV